MVYTFLTLGPVYFNEMGLFSVSGTKQYWLSLSAWIFFTLGGVIAAYMAKGFRNLPRTVAIGVLCFVPFNFAYWNFLDNKTAASTWFWEGLCFISIAGFGVGVVISGTIAYLGKTYRSTLNSNTGKIFGTFYWFVPFMGIFI